MGGCGARASDSEWKVVYPHEGSAEANAVYRHLLPHASIILVGFTRRGRGRRRLTPAYTRHRCSSHRQPSVASVAAVRGPQSTVGGCAQAFSSGCLHPQSCSGHGLYNGPAGGPLSRSPCSGTCHSGTTPRELWIISTPRTFRRTFHRTTTCRCNRSCSSETVTRESTIGACRHVCVRVLQGPYVSL